MIDGWAQQFVNYAISWYRTVNFNYRHYV